jgi:hypothetical protein
VKTRIIGGDLVGGSRSERGALCVTQRATFPTQSKQQDELTWVQDVHTINSIMTITSHSPTNCHSKKKKSDVIMIT